MNEINCFALTSPPKRIVAGGRKLIFYDYDEPTDNHLADNAACLCVLYNPVFYSFITAHPKCIKIWDATTGALQSVFRDLTHKEITAICLDERKRKLFVGDSRGRMFSINIKNGAKMKKFKKGEKSQNKDKEEISAMYYWGAQCVLLAASWDGNVRLFDDSDSSEEGIKKYTMDKHKESVTYLDFKVDEQLCASCGDDGMIFIFNYNSYRQEGNLKLDATNPLPEAVKICKFLAGTDILVSADLDGFIHFWCVTAAPHVKKNQLLCSIRDDSESNVGEKAYFPIRAMDYDPDDMMLYTGDEMGNMNKWDISRLVHKLEQLQPKEEIDPNMSDIQREAKQKMAKFAQNNAFMTSVNLNDQNKVIFHSDDIESVKRWEAHTELIHYVTYVPELSLVSTCSFDCNVFMWDKHTLEKVGSLVLGTSAAQIGQMTEAEQRKYSKTW